MKINFSTKHNLENANEGWKWGWGRTCLSKARYLGFGEDAYVCVGNGRKVGGGCGIRVRGKKGLESERTKHFFFLKKKRRKDFGKAPSSKNVLGMRVRNFLFLNFFVAGEV